MDLRAPGHQLLFSTMRLETEAEGRRAVGTMFAVNWFNEAKSMSTSFFVTCRHVVAGAETGRMWFTQRTPPFGGPILGSKYEVVLDHFAERWHGHPDPSVDIAIMNIGWLAEKCQSEQVYLFWTALDLDLIPSDDQVSQFDAFEEVFFIGYPDDLYDRRNLIPVGRRGVTATPIHIDHEGQPLFLVDASVFPGSSGSPVVILRPGENMATASSGADLGFRALARDFTPNAARPFFVGVMAAVHQRRNIEFRPRLGPIPLGRAVVVTETIDLGLAWKASTVLETIRSQFKGAEQWAAQYGFKLA